MSLALIGVAIWPKGSVFCSTTNPWKYRDLLFDGESQAFRKESSFPGIETVDATSDGQVAVPALSRAKRCAGWGCIGDEVMRGKMVGRGIAADIYDACLGVSANNLSPSKSCQICCSFPRGSRIMACRRSA